MIFEYLVLQNGFKILKTKKFEKAKKLFDEKVKEGRQKGLLVENTRLLLIEIINIDAETKFYKVLKNHGGMLESCKKTLVF